MPTYTIHTDADAPHVLNALERMVPVPDKFSMGAFFLGPIWLLRHRLFLASTVWIAFFAAAVFGNFFVGLPAAMIPITVYGMALLLGLEGHDLRRRWLEKRRYIIVDIVDANTAKDAELRFLKRQEFDVEGGGTPISTTRRSLQPDNSNTDQIGGLA